MKKVKIQLISSTTGELFEEFFLPAETWEKMKAKKGRKSWNTFIGEAVKYQKFLDKKPIKKSKSKIN